MSSASVLGLWAETLYVALLEWKKGFSRYSLRLVLITKVGNKCKGGLKENKLIHIYVKNTDKIKWNLNYLNLQTPKYVTGLF